MLLADQFFILGALWPWAAITWPELEDHEPTENVLTDGIQSDFRGSYLSGFEDYLVSHLSVIGLKGVYTGYIIH